MADSLDSVGAPLRLVADMNQDVFRYGLYKYEDSSFEDPTYLGFTIEIDTNSALFNSVIPFLEKRGQTNSELKSRQVIYQEFKNRIVQIFNSQESALSADQRSIFVKSHYINNISGLNNLTKKFIQWKKDAIEIELHEDITMFSSYLANLYNNLVYSYENARQLVPENLLHFNLHIKISEMRSMTSIGKLASSDPNDQAIANALKNNVTCMVYTLHDCKFDWFDSKAMDDQITQAGIAANGPAPSVLPMKIYFKSVSRQLYTPLIKKSVTMNDAKIDLGAVIVGYTGDLKLNGQEADSSKGSTTNGNSDTQYQKGQITGTSNNNSTNSIFTASGNKRPSSVNSYNNEIKKNPDQDVSLDLSTENQQIIDLKDYNAQFAVDENAGAGIYNKQSGKPLESPNISLKDVLKDPQAAIKKFGENQEDKLGNAANNLKSKGTSIVKQKLKDLENEIKRRRNELVRDFVNDVVKNVGVKKIVPDNVYTKQNTFQQQLIDQIKADIGLGLSGEALNFLTGAR